MAIEETRSTQVVPRREVGTLRLPEAAAEQMATAGATDSSTIGADTRQLLAAMRRIATVETHVGAPAARVAALTEILREGTLDIDATALAQAILRDEGI